MGREACVPCRDRKVRCDVSAQHRHPCSRCVQNARETECVIPPRQKRIIRRRERKQRAVETPQSYEHASTPYFHDPPREADLSDSDGDIIHLANYNVAASQDPVADRAFSGPSDATPQISDSIHAHDNEDYVLQQVCEQIATPHCDGRVHYSSSSSWATVIEYQNPLQATGILGELLARYEQPNRVIQIQQNRNRSAMPQTRRELELLGLDKDEVAFLTAKNVFKLPARDVCKELFEKFFAYAHAYTPVLDRCSMLAQYDTGSHSSFVMQAVLACAIPHASHGLLQRAGFGSHQEALRELNKRAALLYGFNCEKQQLAILQGALLLAAQWITHTGDKDYRFWMSTAIRIAMRMGLHRSDIQHELEPEFYALLKRIWCVVWVRDVLLVTTGLVNERRIPDDCDTVELCEADWDENTADVPEDLRGILTHVSSTQRLFHIHLSRLAVVGRQAHKTVLSQHPSLLNHEQAETVLASIRNWRRELPPQLLSTLVTSWQTDGIWSLILTAWASRIECHIHRAMWRSLIRTEGQTVPASPGLRDAMFSLDAVLKRAVLHDLCKILPLTVTTSAAVNVAIAIELLCQPSTTAGEKAIYEEVVRTGILFLRSVEETWATVRALLSLFAWVIARKGLAFTSGLEPPSTVTDYFANDSMAQNSFSNGLDAGGFERDDEIANALLFSNDPFFGLQGWSDGNLFATV